MIHIRPNYELSLLVTSVMCQLYNYVMWTVIPVSWSNMRVREFIASFEFRKYLFSDGDRDVSERATTGEDGPENSEKQRPEGSSSSTSFVPTSSVTATAPKSSSPVTSVNGQYQCAPVKIGWTCSLVICQRLKPLALWTPLYLGELFCIKVFKVMPYNLLETILIKSIVSLT